MSTPYVGRLAPSPTGYLHLGHAATFLVASARARNRSGDLILRIDDLDPQRSKERYLDATREDLHWLGLHWEAELRQSERVSLYKQAMQRLLSEGYVYPCTCSRKDLQQATQAPHEDSDDEPVYQGRCRTAAALQRDGPRAPMLPATNYRFRVSDGEVIRFEDLSCGLQSFTAGVDFGDFLVWRKDGLPSYQLATVVDDADLRITEVVRGRDLLKSTARQILLQRALDLFTPFFFHVELVRDEDGQRLAKRHDALSLRALRDSGVTPAAIHARVEELLHHSKL